MRRHEADGALPAVMHVLVVHYSRSGHTARLAGVLARELGARGHRVSEETIRPRREWNKWLLALPLLPLLPFLPLYLAWRPFRRFWHAVYYQPQQAIRPLVHPDVSGFDLVLLGTPKWLYVSYPVARWLRTVTGLDGVRVAPFATFCGPPLQVFEVEMLFDPLEASLARRGAVPTGRLFLSSDHHPYFWHDEMARFFRWLSQRVFARPLGDFTLDGVVGRAAVQAFCDSVLPPATPPRQEATDTGEPTPGQPGSPLVPAFHQTRQRLFLLSHMRAYTSLVGHLLGSHPEVDGYYELHRNYLTDDDLARQLAQYAAHDALKPGGRYLFDKLLHDTYSVNLALPELADAVVLVSLRPPGPTLASILNLFVQKTGDDLYATPEGAVRYYLDRLATLSGFASQYPGRYRYFDAPLVVEEPARLLAALGRWLDLATPLSDRYRTFSQTGRPGAGDSSPHIAQGRILHAAPPASPDALDPDLLALAQAAWRDCRGHLATHAAEALLR